MHACLVSILQVILNDNALGEFAKPSPIANQDALPVTKDMNTSQSNQKGSAAAWELEWGLPSG